MQAVEDPRRRGGGGVLCVVVFRGGFQFEMAEDGETAIWMRSRLDGVGIHFRACIAAGTTRARHATELVADGFSRPGRQDRCSREEVVGLTVAAQQNLRARDAASHPHHRENLVPVEVLE